MYLDKDLQDLLSVFNEYEVRYLVVGGLAYSFHVEPRGTKTSMFGSNPPQKTVSACTVR